MKKNKLVLIDTGMFCQGMHVKARLYYKYRNTYVLLCKDTTFTPAALERLHQAAEGQNGVYIDEDHYQEIWDESLRIFSQESASYEASYHRVRQEYQHILGETVRLLESMSLGNRDSLQAAESISNTITKEIHDTSPALLLNCINTIYQADDYLYTHCVNVATLNGMLGQWMGLNGDELRRLIKIGLLHDLGKLHVPREIINKPGKLTDEEFVVVKRHPIYSCEILTHAGEHDPRILTAIRQHHEKANGQGYPDGLTGDAICQNARITAVSDVYDAMVSKRCYKDACTPFEVLEQFKHSQFSGLDYQVVNLLLQNITYLLIGIKVKLSSGENGEVVFVRPNDYANPVVKVGDKIFATGEDCRCITAQSTF